MQKIFAEPSEMYDFLKKVVKAQKYYKVYGHELTLIEGQPLADEYILETGEYEDDDRCEFIREAVSSYASSIQMPVDGLEKVVTVHGCAHTSVANRADYGKNGPRRYPWTMNTALNREDKELWALTQWDTLIAIHTKFYSFIPQDLAFDSLCKGLTCEFGDYKFAGGSYSEEVTIAKFDFPEMADKVKAFGLEGYPALLFTTDDIAEHGLNLQLQLIYTLKGRDGKTFNCRCAMGDRLSVTHANGHGVSDMLTNVEKLMSCLTDAAKKLAALKDIEIKNPIEAVYNLCIEAKIKESIRNEVCEDFAAMTFFDKETKVTAYDLYTSLWCAIHYFEEAGLSKAEIVSRSENIARCMYTNWAKVDIPYKKGEEL